MPTFQYQAVDNTGKTEKGFIEADTVRHARKKLRDKEWIPLDVELVKQNKKTHSTKNLNLKEVYLFTEQLSTLIGAGIPLESSLNIAILQNSNPIAKEKLISVRAKVVEGYTFSKALSLYPGTFSSLYCATIAAAERSGNLDFVLQALALYQERQLKIRQKVKQSLIYPGIMTVVGICIVMFLMVSVVPKLIQVFEEVNQTLPVMTLFLVEFSHVVNQFWWLMIIFFVFFTSMFLKLLQIKKIKTKWDHLLLKIPVLGKTILAIEISRYLRTLGTLLKAGVPITEGMPLANKVINNCVLAHRLHVALGKIQEGIKLHQTFQSTNLFTPMTLHLIATGESSGHLEEMLEKTANIEENRVMIFVDNLLTLFEPLLILFMGAIVLLIVLAVLLPVLSMNELVI